MPQAAHDLVNIAVTLLGFGGKQNAPIMWGMVAFVLESMQDEEGDES